MASVVRRLCGWSFGALACVLLAGCGGGDDGGIKVYKVATPQERDRPRELPNDPGTPAPAGPPKARFLGAIIPQEDGSSYFVRFFGPIEKIDAGEKAFDAFVASVRVPGEGDKPISWTVPEGWKEVPNPPQAGGFRVVTIKSADGTSEDLYISTPIAGDVLANVNRWRTDFVGIPAVKDLKDAATEIQVGGKKAYRVDIRGPGAKGR